MRPKIKLAEVRKSRRISQLQLSKMARVSRSYVSEIENGIYVPSVELLCRFSKILRCTLNDLVECGGESNE